MKKIILLGTVLFVLNGFVNAQDAVKVVTVGKQIWTVENLNTSTFRNGDSIPQALSDSDWAKAARNHKPAWCYYMGNPVNGKIYGRLYNWYAVNDKRGLAPKGWHVPTDMEWNKLVEFLGGYKTADIKLKSKVSWDGDGNGDNSTGFAGIPSGQRIVRLGFMGLGNIACFWAANKKDNDEAYYFPLTKHGDTANPSYSKSAGFAVRLIKN